MKRKKAWEPRKPSAGVDLGLFCIAAFFFGLARYFPSSHNLYRLVFLGVGFLMLLVWRVYHVRLTTWHD